MLSNKYRPPLVLIAIILLAAFLRAYRLDQIPPGFQFDQAFYVFDVIRLLQGQFHIFFAAPGGTEPLFPYLAMVGVAMLGVTPFALKVTTTILGVVTIPLIYGLARALFASSNDRNRIALWASFFAAISIWHIFFTRMGERIVLLVLLTVLIYWFFWRAANSFQFKDFGLTGIFLALALYTYPGSRVLPIALVLLTLYLALTDRPNAARYLRGLTITGVVALVLFLPLGIYFIFHPDQFISHTAEVSIFVPHGDVPVEPMTALLQNFFRLAGMFFILGDNGILRNVPHRPIFDPFSAILFIIGVLVWLVSFRSPQMLARRRAMFLGVWISIALAISLLSDDAPNFVRTLPAMPAVMMIAGWGTSTLYARVQKSAMRWGATAALIVIVFSATASSFRDYFIVFANDASLYYAFNSNEVEAAEWLNRHAPSENMLVAPLTVSIGTISLLTRNTPLKSFESRDTVILPGNNGKDAVFVFPPEQVKKVEALAARLGSLGFRQDITGTNGANILLTVRVPANNLPDEQNPLTALNRGGEFVQPQKNARTALGDAFELLGYSLGATDPAKRNVEVTLFFHALKSMDTDYTFSVKARDAKGRVWGQEDKWTGNNSYATTQWSPGDVIIEKFYPGLSACAPAGDYRISVEAYDPKTCGVWV